MRTTRPSALRSTLPALFLLTACGPAIHSERDEAVPVPQGATWTWASRGFEERDVSRAAGDEMVRQRFERAITAAMAAKGFRQVTDSAEARFVFSLGYRAAAQARRPGVGGISIGIMDRWGGRGTLGRPRPLYWWGGWYDPWGWNWFVPMGMMAAAYPAQGVGPMAYREGELVATLRDRESGYLAWRGRVAADRLATPHLSQQRVQSIVDKLFETLP